MNDYEYFNWLCEVVCGGRFSKNISYRKLLSCLNSIEFRVVIPNDSNRAEDGIDLRRRYYLLTGRNANMDCPCTVLEMMVALTIRCEESIMDNPELGNRTGQWFWSMIRTLGLSEMVDDRFDELFVRNKIDIFLNREYEPNGEGGLFKIKHCRRDLRNVEIWYQLCWYLDQFV